MRVLHSPRRSVKGRDARDSRDQRNGWADGPSLEWHLRQMANVTEKAEMVGAYMLAYLRANPHADQTDAYSQMRRDIDEVRSAMAEEVPHG